MQKRRKYTNEFKEEAVKVALSSDQSLAQTASEFGINKTTFYGWVKDNMANKTDIPSGKNLSNQMQALEEENKRLKQQLKRTEQERDILKKAAAYFAIQDL